MRRTTGFLGLVCVAAIALAGCSATSSPSAAGGGAGSPAGGAGSPAGGAGESAPLTNPDLVGTDWALGDLPGQVLADVRPTIAFSGDGTVSGSGGCNDFSGTYTVDGSNLTFGPLASTKKACADAVNTLETAYLAALQATSAYEITDAGELKLTSGSTTITFTKAT